METALVLGATEDMEVSGYTGAVSGDKGHGVVRQEGVDLVHTVDGEEGDGDGGADEGECEVGESSGLGEVVNLESGLDKS